MLVADRVIREQGTNKVYVLGTFDRILSPRFPTRHDTLNVYLALTEGTPGEHEGKLQIVYIDDKSDVMGERELLSMKGALKFSADKLQVVELVMELRGVIFPRPGTLEIRFSVGAELIEWRRFRVEQLPEREKSANG